jgi:hypothetical protein
MVRRPSLDAQPYVAINEALVQRQAYFPDDIIKTKLAGAIFWHCGKW